MNSFNVIGFFVKDPIVETTTTKKNVEIKFTKFTLGVKDRGATDFLTFVAWRGVGENIVKHCKKGDQIGLSGKIKAGNYEGKDGEKVYYTNMKIENVDFIGDKQIKRISTLPNETVTDYDKYYNDNNDGIKY
jgi:single-strand DNA-binding protein